MKLSALFPLWLTRCVCEFDISLDVLTQIPQLGDAREPVRNRVSLIFRSLPKVYAYSRIFQILLDNGLKAKVAKTRQGSLDEMSVILKKSGMGACEPTRAMPVIAALISDKDPAVRKSALAALGYVVFNFLHTILTG